MIYVCLDCNKTQDYVFSSRRLRGIRNGSRALEKCDKEAGQIPARLGGETIRALGAVVIAKFPDRPSTDSFVRQARDLYSQYGITFESAYVECVAPADFYQEVLAPMLSELRAKKESPRHSVLGPPSTILAATCDISGRGSAHGLVSLASNDSQRANSAEKAKLSLPRNDPEAETLVDWAKAALPYSAEGIVAWSSSEKVKGKEVPGTSEERFLGVVFADVNGLGTLLPKIAIHEGEFKEFVTSLHNCLKRSLKQALQDVLQEVVHKRRVVDPRKEAVPFQLLFLGGDDICFAVVGAYALQVTQRFIKRFEASSSKILEPLSTACPGLPSRLTLSAGVVIAPYRYPILSFRRLGQQGLEKRAKQIGRSWAYMNGYSYPPSMVDLYVVKNTVSGTLEDVRRGENVSFEGERVDLFGGPYLASSSGNGEAHPASHRFLPLSNLLEAAGKMNRIEAGGKLKDLYRILTRGATSYHYREWWDHLTQKDRERWVDICGQLEVPADRRPPIRNYPHHNTPVVDALELAPLMALQKRWER